MSYYLSLNFTLKLSPSFTKAYFLPIPFTLDARLSPYDLQMLQITRTSAEIQWLPANSSYAHEVFLDNSLLQCVNPAISSYTLNELSPSTLYRARIRTQIPSHLRLAIGKASTEDNLSSEIEFTTLAGGNGT